MYECDVHFEHCYALDMSGTTIEAKRACWQDWLSGYTYGQSRDRVEYARARVKGTVLADQPEDGDADVSRGPTASIVATPPPTNAFTTPARVIDGHSGALDAGEASVDAGR
jgi:hypothetical protein